MATNARRPKILTATRRAREAAREKLQDAFEAEVRAHAERLTSRGWLSTWQRNMQETVRRHTLQQAMLGAGRPLSASEVRSLDAVVRRQNEKFLARFAEEIAAKRLRRAALNVDAIAGRGQMYGGVGREQWFRYSEKGEVSNVIYYYEARDDRGTCSPCLGAARKSPYLPNEGAMPGSICRGRGKCRCRRRRVVSTEVYRKLVAES